MIIFTFTCRRYGFDRDRSRQALEAGPGGGLGEVGTTLEFLLSQVFSERFGSSALAPQVPDPPSREDCAALRQEEALALTAIYGERFTERISDRVWTIDLDLLWLTESQTRSSQSNNGRHPKGSSSTQLCKFYLKGSGCKFGSRCKFKHQKESSDHKDSYGPSRPGFSSFEPPVYQLEVRFPPGSRYPYQPPFVAFSTTDEAVPGAGRLNVTEYLFSQSLTAAQEGEPVVYTLISCLEEDGPVRELLSTSHHKYSSPPPVLAPPAVTTTKSRSTKNTIANSTPSCTTTTSRSTNTPASESTSLRVKCTEGIVSMFYPSYYLSHKKSCL